MVEIETEEVERDILKTITEIEGKFKELYNKMTKEVEKHLNSENSLPNVTKKISDNDVTPLAAMKTVVESSFEGQKLSNSYYVIYAPKFNDMYHDAKALTNVLYNSFMNDNLIKSVKTSAEKERLYNTFSEDVLSVWDKIKNMQENTEYLGKYIESVMYSLSRIQNMIESLDKLRDKEMWVDSVATTKAISVIADSDSELSSDDFIDEDFDDELE